MAGMKQVGVAALLVLAAMTRVVAALLGDAQIYVGVGTVFNGSVGVFEGGQLAADSSFGKGGVLGAKADSSFGKGWVFDTGVRIKDTEVGVYTGLYWQDSTSDGSSLQYASTIKFTKGDYQGSSLVLAGHGPAWPGPAALDGEVQELAVIGGTGVFKFARGSAVYTKLPSGGYDVKITLKDVQSE